MGRAAPVGLRRVDPVGPRLVARVDLVGLMGPAALGGRPRLGLVVPVDLMIPAAPEDRHRMVPVVPGRVGLADLMDRTALVGPMVRDRMGLAAPVVPGDPVGLNTAGLAVLMAPAVQEDLGDLMGPDTVGPAAPVDRHRRPTCNRVTMTVVARSGVVRGTHRTASALQVYGAPPPPPQNGFGWNGGPPPGAPPPNWDGPPPPGGWNGPPPPGGWNPRWNGPAHDIGWGQANYGPFNYSGYQRRHRSSTRYSGAGASGSWVRGFRCTDLSSDPHTG